MKSAGKDRRDVLRSVWVKVSVEPGFQDEDVSVDDRVALGIHAYVVPAAMDDGMAAALAMGIFHSTVAVENLGVLRFEVLDDRQVELVPSTNVDWYQLADQYHGQIWQRRPRDGEASSSLQPTP